MEKTIKMKFKDAPIGARFNFIGDDVPKDVYVKINTHKVLDLVYTEEEGQCCFTGTHEECFDFMTEQTMAFTYKIVPLTEEEKVWVNEA